jgi:SAF domain
LALIHKGFKVAVNVVQMKRWLVAFVALAIGGGVSAALLVAADPSRNAIDVYVAARDLPAGASLGADALVLERITLTSGRSLLFGRGDESALAGMHATHDLASGQLLQRSDVTDSSSIADRRLVFVPVRDVPAADAGSKVDLLVIGGAADHPTVVPFALGVEVRSIVPGGLVVVVASNQAAAFVYAANAMHLAAVIAEPGAAVGVEGPISSPDQAMAAAAHP